MFSLQPPRHISTLPAAEVPEAASHFRFLGRTQRIPTACPPWHRVTSPCRDGACLLRQRPRASAKDGDAD
jgi:hypothetical protein